jgi:hypothetical protein
VAVSGLAIIIAIGTLTYPSFRRWRATHLVEDARTQLEAGNEALAWERARAARQLNPTDLELTAEVARLAERVSPRQAAELWSVVIQGTPNSREAQEGLIRALLILREDRRLEDSLEEYRKAHGENRFYLRAVTRFWQILNRPVLAAREAWKLTALDEIETEDQWFAIEAGLDSPRKADNDRSRERLRQMALESEPSQARRALRRFCELPRLSAGELDFAIRRWEVLAESGEDRLVALELKLEGGLASRDAVAEEAKQYFDLGEGSSLLRLGRWYNWQGLYGATLEVISEQRALERNDLFLVRLDALALVENWEAVKSLLELSRIPLERYAEEIFRMRSLYELGENSRAAIAWSRALQAARGDARQLRFLARYTEKLELLDYTEEALWALSEAAGYKRLSYLAIIGLHERLKDTRRVRDTLAAMRVDFPHDYAVANDWAYYSLLLRDQMGTAETVTNELIGLNPNQLSHRMNHILMLLQEDREREAMAYLETLVVPNWLAIESSRWKALVAVVLKRIGREDDADRLLQTVDQTRLMPEELFLIQEAWRR